MSPQPSGQDARPDVGGAIAASNCAHAPLGGHVRLPRRATADVSAVAAFRLARRRQKAAAGSARPPRQTTGCTSVRNQRVMIAAALRPRNNSGAIWCIELINRRPKRSSRRALGASRNRHHNPTSDHASSDVDDHSRRRHNSGGRRPHHQPRRDKYLDGQLRDKRPGERRRDRHHDGQSRRDRSRHGARHRHDENRHHRDPGNHRHHDHRDVPAPRWT